MLFSVLVANYNNGNFFIDCYKSIIAQTYSDWEVIIVDDCSTDDSVKVIRELIDGDKRFKLFLNEKNYGCGYSKRKCAALAVGDICGFVDPDDTIVPEALHLMTDAHEANPDAALVHSTFHFCDEHLNHTSLYEIPESFQVTNRFTNLQGKVNHFSSYKNSFYKKTDGIEPGLLRAVDQDLYLKLSETGSFYFINKALYNYRVHGNGIATANVDKAFYWYLKVIARAEERRGVNLEEEVATFLNRTDARNVQLNMANPRYLLLQLLKALKADPSKFFKRLFLNR